MLSCIRLLLRYDCSIDVNSWDRKAVSQLIESLISKDGFTTQDAVGQAQLDDEMMTKSSEYLANSDDVDQREQQVLLIMASLQQYGNSVSPMSEVGDHQQAYLDETTYLQQLNQLMKQGMYDGDQQQMQLGYVNQMFDSSANRYYPALKPQLQLSQFNTINADQFIVGCASEYQQLDSTALLNNTHVQNETMPNDITSQTQLQQQACHNDIGDDQLPVATKKTFKNSRQQLVTATCQNDIDDHPPVVPKKKSGPEGVTGACKVCGNDATHHYYGALSCTRCKVSLFNLDFFIDWRILHFNYSYG